MLKTDTSLCGLPVKDLKRHSFRRVVLVCDGCGFESETTWQNYMTAQERVGMTGETLCRTCAHRNAGLKRRGSIPHNKGKKLPLSKLGVNHPGWKGGRYISPDGYVMVRTKARAKGWSGYRKEHLVVMEKKLRRKIKKGESVHHIDGDKQNNDPGNLVLCKSHADHRGLHSSLDSIAYSLVKAGLVQFDAKRRVYDVAHLKLRELLGHPEEGNQQPSPR